MLGDARGDTEVAAWSLAEYWCKATTNCPAGAVYVPTPNGGQNVDGCKDVGGLCTGTCVYCSGGGTANVCMSRTHEVCIYTSISLQTCGTRVQYTCVPAATPPATPAGQPLVTDNGCYCGTTPATPTTTSCEFSDCN